MSREGNMFRADYDGLISYVLKEIPGLAAAAEEEAGKPAAEILSERDLDLSLYSFFYEIVGCEVLIPALRASPEMGAAIRKIFTVMEEMFTEGDRYLVDTLEDALLEPLFDSYDLMSAGLALALPRTGEKLLQLMIGSGVAMTKVSMPPVKGNPGTDTTS